MEQQKVRFPFLTIFVLALASLVTVQAFGQPGPGALPPFAVGTIEVAPVDFPARVQYPGVVEGRTKINIYTEVNGQILKQDFEEGNWVEKDQILFEIDPQNSASRITQAEAAVKDAQVKLDSAEAQLSRKKTLLERGSLAKQDYDNTTQERDVAKAALASAQAVLEQTKTEADKTMVTAPVSGYVGAANKTVGDLVDPNSTDLAYLTYVEDMSAVKVNYYVPETHVTRYRAMAKTFGVDMETLGDISATLLIAGQPYHYSGRMEHGSGRVERRSGVLAARATFPNPDRDLFSGQVARVELEIMTLKGILAIPQSAIIYGQTLAVAVVGPDNVVEFRPIVAQGPVNGFFLMKNDGTLALGEKIVLEGLNKVGPGQPVQPRPAQTIPTPKVAENNS
ncbi:MAG: efflux RND transporter periplasmic adaptor subunit [Deltaproteobacteria bacterium]|jgi:membrane fusion protein (multidrug efflux system)|nr:efflux RND transporter periplasmic adaptor subunit [Deltaproteobacteria bacterium]